MPGARVGFLACTRKDPRTPGRAVDPYRSAQPACGTHIPRLCRTPTPLGQSRWRRSPWASRSAPIRFALSHPRTAWWGRGCLCVRILTVYTFLMIRSSRHKGVRRFFETGSKAGIQAAHAARLARQLSALDQGGRAGGHECPGLGAASIAGPSGWALVGDRQWQLAADIPVREW